MLNRPPRHQPHQSPQTGSHDGPENAEMSESTLIEAYLDDLLSAAERRRFEQRLLTDADVAAELRFAQRIQEGLRQLPVERCPESVVGHQPPHLRAHRWWQRALAAVPRPVVWQGATAAAALALTAALAAPWLIPSVSPPHVASHPGVEASQPTSAEVAQAQHDVELAFAYLGRLGRTAESSVRDLASQQTGEAL